MMTTDIEKQFFETFGIESKWGTVCNHFDCQEFEKAKFYHFDKGICCGCYHSTDGFYYPQITDRILFELICIIGSIYICTQDRKTLKEHILIQCMNTQTYGKDIKHQVRKLFEEE